MRSATSPSSRPRLSIVIPTYNGRAVLEPCLETVAEHRPRDSEVIVVDDGSIDGTAGWVRSAHPDVRLIRLRRNHGFCTAVNAGIGAARGEIVETLNNDTLVTPGWTEPALDLFADATVGSVAPLVLKWPEAEVVDSAGDLYHVSGFALNRGHLRPPTEDLLRPCEVFGTSAAAGFYRRDALLRVGAFPDNFRAYYDDVDVAFRLRWAGYRCMYTPDSRVYHRVNFSHDLRQAELVRQNSLNEERVFWTGLPAAWLRRAVVPHALLVVAKALLRALQGLGRPYMAGKIAALREVSSLRRRRGSNQSLACGLAPVFPIETTSALVGIGIRLQLRKLLGSAHRASGPDTSQAARDIADPLPRILPFRPRAPQAARVSAVRNGDGKVVAFERTSSQASSDAA